MNLLLFDACTYTMDDIADTLKSHNVSFRHVLYHLTNIYKDEFFLKKMSQYIDEGSYDAVLSINYFPILAALCYKKNIKYLAWSYDSPLNISNIEKTLSYPTTYFFLFDKNEQETYAGLGFQNVFHLPLCIAAGRLSRLSVTKARRERFQCDVSLVGQIYESVLPTLLMPLTKYQQGYIEGIFCAQQKIYGCNFIEELLTDAFMDSVNVSYQKLGQTAVSLQKQGLASSIAKQITRQERLLLLNLLGEHYVVDYYSHKKDGDVTNARFRGTVHYKEEMPFVFLCSRINLNPTLRTIVSGIPLRALDILGSGGFLLSAYQPELQEYFEDGVDLILYTSLEDALEKADYYLAHESARLQIASNGRQKAHRHFSYDTGLAALLQTAGLLNSESDKIFHGFL